MRLVKTLQLKDDTRLIREYCEAHDKIWPEIRSGIKAVGIENMELYLLGNLAVMIVELPDDANPDEVFSRLATMPRQQEWEKYVAKFQECREDDSSAEKWHEMDNVFKL